MTSVHAQFYEYHYDADKMQSQKIAREEDQKQRSNLYWPNMYFCLVIVIAIILSDWCLHAKVQYIQHTVIDPMHNLSWYSKA